MAPAHSQPHGVDSHTLHISQQLTPDAQGKAQPHVLLKRFKALKEGQEGMMAIEAGHAPQSDGCSETREERHTEKLQLLPEEP